MSRVLLAMSGGVDSSVAAYILQKEGHEVIGATIKTWSSDECSTEKAKGCCSIRDVEDARAVAQKLDFPFYVLDLSPQFKEKVIDYFVETYLDGFTPNPCIACNHHIKFGVFLKKAKEISADYVATGHYARRCWDEKNQRWYVREGIDSSKDQSYVLFGLTQEQIKNTLFPVGGYKKSEIRRLAQEMGLRNFDKPDSQEICFVKNRYSDFIEEQGISLPGKGEFVDLDGRILGHHPGYYHFTIGQRRGISITNDEPYYVLKVDANKNQVVIGSRDDLQKKSLRIHNVNWMTRPSKKDYEVKIRSKHERKPARIVSWSDSNAHIEFYEAEDAITPGQAAVVYDQDAVLGGGWIHQVD